MDKQNISEISEISKNASKRLKSDHITSIDSSQSNLREPQAMQETAFRELFQMHGDLIFPKRDSQQETSPEVKQEPFELESGHFINQNNLFHYSPIPNSHTLSSVDVGMSLSETTLTYPEQKAKGDLDTYFGDRLLSLLKEQNIRLPDAAWQNLLGRKLSIQEIQKEHGIQVAIAYFAADGFRKERKSEKIPHQDPSELFELRYDYQVIPLHREVGFNVKIKVKDNHIPFAIRCAYYELNFLLDKGKVEVLHCDREQDAAAKNSAGESLYTSYHLQQAWELVKQEAHQRQMSLPTWQSAWQEVIFKKVRNEETLILFDLLKSFGKVLSDRSQHGSNIPNQNWDSTMTSSSPDTPLPERPLNKRLAWNALLASPLSGIMLHFLESGEAETCPTEIETIKIILHTHSTTSRSIEIPREDIDKWSLQFPKDPPQDFDLSFSLRRFSAVPFNITDNSLCRAIEQKGYQIDVVTDLPVASMQWPQTMEIKPIRKDAEPLALQELVDYIHGRVDAKLCQRAIEKIARERDALPTVNTLLETIKNKDLDHQLECLERQPQNIKDSCAYQLIESRLRIIQQKGIDHVKALLVGQVIDGQATALSKVTELIDHISPHSLQKQIAILSKEDDRLIASSLAFKAIREKLEAIQQGAKNKQSHAQQTIEQWKADIPELTEQLKRVFGMRDKIVYNLNNIANSYSNYVSEFFTKLAEEVQQIKDMNQDSLADRLIEEQIKMNESKPFLLQGLSYYCKTTGEQPEGFAWEIQHWWPKLEDKPVCLAIYTPAGQEQGILYVANEIRSLSQAVGYNESKQTFLQHIFDPKKVSFKSMTVKDENGTEIGTWRNASVDPNGKLPVESDKPIRVHLDYLPHSGKSEIVTWVDQSTKCIYMVDQQTLLSQEIGSGKASGMWLSSLRSGKTLRSYLWPLL